jgi:hypothetical protein
VRGSKAKDIRRLLRAVKAPPSKLYRAGDGSERWEGSRKWYRDLKKDRPGAWYRLSTALGL